MKTHRLEFFELVPKMVDASFDINKELGASAFAFLGNLQFLLGLRQMLLELGQHALITGVPRLA